MSTTTVSGSAPAADDGLLRNTFHVVPPPPPRQKVWSELGIAVGLALLINLIVILSFILRAPVATPPADPPAISVDLVQEPQPEPQQPEPEPQPQPEPQPEPQREAPEITPFSRSGEDTEAPAGLDTEPDDSPLQTDSKEDKPEPDEKTTREQKKQTKEDIPGWAQTILPGFDIRSGKPDASSREQQAARSSGGANEYFNRMRDAILANVNQAETTDLQGSSEFEVIIHRSGKITSLRLMRSSGFKTLDQAFANAIIRTQPYRYPAGIQSDFLPIIVELKSRPSDG
ncbi:MAG: hypothetical protein CVT81_01505 [Alphaproteobacteria bacterium HGW-Alphaproteobacteria-3]|nr:MAG: hypothetical protein CVT81_01505 [Alphaproteobacteria bacterium HGW-Alphaproteobacteria-3]